MSRAFKIGDRVRLKADQIGEHFFVPYDKVVYGTVKRRGSFEGRTAVSVQWDEDVGRYRKSGGSCYVPPHVIEKCNQLVNPDQLELPLNA